ncbi:unnamed protein product, partial [Ectocarpus sp. 12 AP-2014]
RSAVSIWTCKGTQRKVWSRCMRNNYTNKVLKYVPRTVPPAPVLLDRFDFVMDAFKDVRDAKTGNLLFTDRLKKAIANLRVHIQN